jgi:outer membrane receptor protein involved in Fe transport
VEIDNWGIDTLHPEQTTPDFQSWGWNVAINEKSAISSGTLVETSLAVKSFDVAVRPQSAGTSRLLPSGLRGNYFNELNRESERWDFNFSCSQSIEDWHGSHVMKFGTQLAHMSFKGTDRSRLVQVLGADGRLLRTIDFVGEPDIGAADVEVSGFAQDQWRPTSRLGLDLGVRFDYERITGASHLSPRFAFAYALREDGSTIVKGGVGIFFDQVFLHADSFERFQKRVETEYGPDGRPIGPSLVFENRIAPDGIHVPRSTTWNVEVNQALGRDWMLRVNYRERDGRKEMVIDRLEDAPDGPTLLLSSRGISTLRELDVTARKSFPDGGELFLSYVKSRSTGDLNDFGTVYYDLREPVLLDSEYSLQAFDVPHRILVWGVLQLPKGIALVPGFEWRQGFPFTNFNEDWTVSGERNRGGRFPSVFAVDLRVTKEISLLGKRLRVGFQLFNLTSHFNPRDVQSNLASPTFGGFSNSRGISGGLKLQITY